MVIYPVESVSNTSPLQTQVLNMEILWRYCSLDEVLFCTENSPPKIGRGEDPQWERLHLTTSSLSVVNLPFVSRNG